MLEYGTDTFTIHLLEEHSNLEITRKREAELIVEHNTRAPEGYNIHIGGLGGDNISKHPNNDQIRKKLSAAHLLTQKRGADHPRYIHYPEEVEKKVVSDYFSFELPSPLELISRYGISSKDVLDRIIEAQGSRRYRSKIVRFEQNTENLENLYNRYFIKKETVKDIMQHTTLSGSSISYLLKKYYSLELPNLKKLHQKHKKVGKLN